MSLSRPLPYGEDFEGGVLPEGWTTQVDFNLDVDDDHNAGSFVLNDNVYEFDTPQGFEATMPSLGPIIATDTLLFDYRFVDFIGGGENATVLSPNDIFTVLVSTDCGEVFEVVSLITGDNHVPTNEFTTVEIPLSEYAGEEIVIQFVVQWGSGDYYFDLDNIFLPRCTGTLGLEAEITNASADANDGQISLTPTVGIAPFTYEWADGAMGSERTGLAPGDYAVTVTDRFGCMDELVATVDVIIGIEELTERFGSIRVAPNPTNGLTSLNVQFNEKVDAQVQVLNLLGQPVWLSAPLSRVNQIDETIDLTDVPAGIYLIRIQAGDEARVMKVVKSN